MINGRCMRTTYSLIRELEQMSYRDQLTGIGNRHAMNKYLDNLQREQSLGIVYCDVTGLKQMNDQKGHVWGDKLIVDACDCLKSSFGEYSLFRIGGDELSALHPDRRVGPVAGYRTVKKES